MSFVFKKMGFEINGADKVCNKNYITFTGNSKLFWYLSVSTRVSTSLEQIISFLADAEISDPSCCFPEASLPLNGNHIYGKHEVTKQL